MSRRREAGSARRGDTVRNALRERREDDETGDTFLLLEGSGDRLLLEDGGRIMLEGT